MQTNTETKAPFAEMLSDGDLLKMLDLRAARYDAIADEQMETEPARSVHNRMTARVFRHAAVLIASEIGCARAGA